MLFVFTSCSVYESEVTLQSNLILTQEYGASQNFTLQYSENLYVPVYDAIEYVAELASSDIPDEYVTAQQHPESQFPPPSRFTPLLFEPNYFINEQVFLFLKDFYSLYSFGELDEIDGTYICRHTRETLDERPLVLFHWEILDNRRGDLRFYDRMGEQFDDVVFLRDFDVVAEFFKLFDINNDGVPEIFIHWALPDTSLRGNEIFMFIDGQYQSIGGIEWGFQLFYDYQGRLIQFMDSQKYDWYAYYFLTFADNTLVREEIISINRGDADFPQWEEHHRRYEFAENPTIFGTNLPLTPIVELTDFQESILKQLQEHTH